MRTTHPSSNLNYNSLFYVAYDGGHQAPVTRRARLGMTLAAAQGHCGDLSTNYPSKPFTFKFVQSSAKDANKVAQTHEVCYDFVYYFTKVTQVAC